LAHLWLTGVLEGLQRADLTRRGDLTYLTSAGHRLVNTVQGLGSKSNPPHAHLTPGDAATVVIVVAIVAAVAFAWWRINVEINPYAPCRRCKGSGLGRFSRKSAFNLCKHGKQRTRAFAKGAAARHDRRKGLS
jgi:hypothetical protein